MDVDDGKTLKALLVPFPQAFSSYFGQTPTQTIDPRGALDCTILGF